MSQLTRPGKWIAPTPRNMSREFWLWAASEAFWLRVGVCVTCTVFVYVLAAGWAPAFPYRVRQHLPRSLNARVAFEIDDPEATRLAREAARARSLTHYEHDPQQLRELRQALVDATFAVLEKKPEEVLENEWRMFWPSPPPDSTDPVQATAESLDRFRKALVDDEKLEKLRLALDKAFVEYDQSGLLETLGHEFGEGSMREIKVYPRGSPEAATIVPVSKVRTPEIANELKKKILTELIRESGSIADPQFVADRMFDWLRPQLPRTLELNREASRAEADKAAREVETKSKKFNAGDRLLKPSLETGEVALVGGGVPLSELDVALLRTEHQALIDNMSWINRLVYSFTFFGLFASGFGLISGYLLHRDRSLLDNFRRFSSITLGFSLAFCILWLLSMDGRGRLEIIGIVLFAMTIAIAWHIELAIILSSLVALLFTLLHGFDLSEFVVLASAGSVSAMFSRSIRSRTKSVYIGLITAAIIFPITVCSELLISPGFSVDMLVDAMWYAGGAGAAGLLMTALLPFMERWLGIQTDISLLELSDPNNELLRQLVQRAPGTYNHSINVASIAEAAADAVGANGLLCRVGAYYHDIGKMRKPEYFVENQATGQNRHDDLVPTMSTLVIISHVRDGVEMARQNHLPQRIIDMIEQHHGTTVVEYFYMRATQEADEATVVSDSSFRYPGPRPQSAEAAVLMLSDSVEGATRTLREPSPARIESLVAAITQKKLDDGQLDECSLTMKQLRIIEASLVKSLNAMYHARVKYPE